MIATRGTDSQQYALPFTGAPILVSDNLHGPVEVVNLGDQRLFMGSSSSVSPQNGAPVEPGTARVWRDQELWLTAAPGVQGLAAVSDRASGYSPSPAALAAATAFALVQSGVPLTYTSDVLVPRAPLAAGAVITVDVDTFASLVITVDDGGAQAGAVVRYDAGVGTNRWTSDVVGSATGEPATVAVPIGFSTVTFRNVGLFPANLTVVGSSRQVPDTALVSTGRGAPRLLRYVGAGPAVFNAPDGGTKATRFDRQMTAAVFSAGVAGVLGFFAYTPDGSLNRFDVASIPASTVTMLTITQPKQAVSWVFQPATGGALDVSLGLWAA